MNPNTEPRPLGTDRADGNPHSLEKVRAVFSCLSKLVLGKKIYAKKNPTLLKFASEFDAALHDFFIDEDELVVSIEKHTIRWEGHVVYENDRRDESIAFLLYKDGVGEISINRSVTPREMEIFVDLIKSEVRSVSQEEDIVTKLWKADFEHIFYRVLDEYLVGEFGEGRRGEGESSLSTFETEDHPDIPSFKDKGRIIVGEGSDLEPIDSHLLRLLEHSAAGMTDIEKEEHFQEMVASIFAVSGDELRRCQRELLDAKGKDNVISFMKEYLEFTLLPEHPSAVRDVVNVVECLTDSVTSEMNGSALGSALTCIREFASSRKLPENLQTFFQALEDKLTHPSVLLSLREAGGSIEENPERIFDYYRVVGEKAIPTIRKILEEHADVKLHKAACETLIDIAGDELIEIIDQLDIDKPQIARDVIVLIKAAEPEKLPHVIKELVYYPDQHVRDEAIRFVAGFGKEEAVKLMAGFLDDPEKVVRLRTMSVIQEDAKPIIRDKIKEKATGRDFGQLDLDEQTEIIKAFGRLEGRKAIPHLRRMLVKKNLFLFGKRQNKDNKLLVVRALEQIKEPGAAGLLRELSKDSDIRVSTKASQLLRELKSNTADPRDEEH